MSALTHEIVNHIFQRLGILNRNLHHAYISILDNEFLLDKKICLLNDREEEIHNNMWSCKLKVEEKEFRILLADCSVDEEKEYALIISLQDSPIYGCYLSSDRESSLIANLLNEVWGESTIYVQASFLTGMEQIKDLSMPWIFNDKTNDLYDHLVSFIKYHNEVNYER